MIKKILANKKIIFILKCIEVLVLLFLSFKMVLNLCYVSESLFQTIRSYYLWVSIGYLMIALLIIGRVKLHWSQLLIVGGGTILGYLISKPYWEAIDVMNLFKAQYFAVILGIIFILDLFVFKRECLKKIELKSIIIWLCIFLVVLLVGKGKMSTVVVLFPALPFYMTLLDKNCHQKVIFTLSSGYYLAFLYTMIKSFIMVPYTGERYYGIFINHGLFGIFIGGAFVCALYWLIKGLQKKSVIIIVFSGVAVLFAIVCLFINAARIAQVSCVLLFACAALLKLIRRNPQKSVKYISLISGIGILGIAVVIVVLVMLHNTPKESLQQVLQESIFEEFVLYWKGRADTTFNAKSKYDVIPPGTILNAIDRFTSARISYCLLYLQRLNWFGHEYTSLEVGKHFLMHPHNTFVFWLFGFGIIGGGLLIIGLCVSLAKMLIQYFKDNEDVFFPILWLLYFAFVSMGEVVQWTYSVGFIFVLILYPVFCKKNVEKKESRKNVK